MIGDEGDNRLTEPPPPIRDVRGMSLKEVLKQAQRDKLFVSHK